MFCINNLVSIITPCYNGEKTIARLMDSILNQTYKKIEFILINDGSTDKTEEIVKGYEQKFIEQGMVFKYIYQENQGLGGAINTGLKHFTGEFLCWPDADDYLEPTSIEERVDFLEDNPDCAVVTSNAYIRNENDLDNPKLLIEKVTDNILRKNQFDLMLNGDSVFCSGCHMVRTEAFLQVNPEREIYQARRGQNWQLLLPLYYKFNRGFLDRPLYNYIIYRNSMSKDDNTMEKMLLRYSEHETILMQSLKQIEKNLNVDLEKFFNFITDKYFKLRLSVALAYNDKKYFNQQYIEKQEIIGLDFYDKFLYYINKLSKAIFICRKIIRGSDVKRFVMKKLNRTKTRETFCRELVTVVVPCYNGEKFLDDCFASILRQSYKNVELIVVNDGSTDNSEEKILSYKSKIEDKGYIFKYLKQENQGAAAAVNNALKITNGNYLMLYDVDDILFPDNIKCKAEFLYNNPEYSMVRNNGYYVKSRKELGKLLFVNSKKEMQNTAIFEALLNGTTNNWPGSYMVRTAVLFEALSGKEIYTSHYGQNLQIMMPVALCSKTAFINEPLMKYFIHNESHSHSGGRERALERSKGYERNRYGVLEQLNVSDEELNDYKKIVQNKFCKLRLKDALLHRDENLFKEEYSKLCNKKIFYKISWVFSKTKLFKILNLVKRVNSRVKNAIRNFYYVTIYCLKNTKSL